VHRDGLEIPLPRLSFDLLLALVRAAPRIATLDELMGRVWPGLVVSPETVSQRVSLLRAALDDNPREPRYVAVVRGRGYRLLVPVSLEPTPALAATGAENAARLLGNAGPPGPPAASNDIPSGNEAPVSRGERTSPGVSRRRWLWSALGVALLLSSVFGAFLLRTPIAVTTVNAPPPERSIAVLPFENVGASADGAALAPGIAEAVLHQLASVRELTVVARTSSFAFKGHDEDARVIGRKLSARYLLEGSVQTEGKQMRVTAQLIDSTTGAQLWSVRIDKAPRDIFAVQDEIALEVARALKLSLDASTTDRLTGQGTANFDAYLAYLQGRAHAASLRIADLKLAVDEFTHATNIDPSFAPAYVELADAELLLAEYDLSEDREEKFAAAVDHGKALVERALQLDPANGHAFVERAYLRAFSDLAGAESDYRRGIALSPSYAKAYAGLAAVLNENPVRWTETLAALDRARKLDPLQPEYDVMKAVFLLYRRSDIQGANDLLVDVLQREPLYQPALMRLGQVRWHFQGRFAEAVKYGEQALSLDPASEWTRRYVVRAYLDLGEPAAAEKVAREGPHEMPIRSLPLLMYRHDWRRAGDAVYAADDDGTLSPIDETLAAPALRMHARVTKDYAQSIAALEKISDISWDDAGRPHLPTKLGMMTAAVALADVLKESGEEARARRLLRAVLAEMEHGAKDLQRGEFWYMRERPMALMLLGDTEGAMQALQRAFAASYSVTEWWFSLEADPVYEPLRADARFKAMLEEARGHAREEHEALARLRKEAIVPAR
jgi:TolB-like protein/DNA-binding winged helix-turn-helix (wHTH) protein